MTEDGAHLGYGPEAAMRGAIGGERPKKLMTAMEMRELIEQAREPATDYNGSGLLAAKYVLGYLERHPEDSEAPADSEREYDAAWKVIGTKVVGLTDLIERKEPETAAAIDAVGLSGFLWGWAVNAARRCLELPPVHNPAILTIGGGS
jgi:hypothetical protein